MQFKFILSENNTKVDLSALRDWAKDDLSSIKPIINLFLKNMPPTIQKLNRFYELKDWENLSNTAHYAKSSVSVIKENNIYEAVVAIELKAKNKIELDTIKPLINLIEREYVIVEKLLQKELLKLA